MVGEEQVGWKGGPVCHAGVRASPTLQASGNHQRQEGAENRKVLMEERASNLGLGK